MRVSLDTIRNKGKNKYKNGRNNVNSFFPSQEESPTRSLMRSALLRLTKLWINLLLQLWKIRRETLLLKMLTRFTKQLLMNREWQSINIVITQSAWICVENKREDYVWRSVSVPGRTTRGASNSFYDFYGISMTDLIFVKLTGMIFITIIELNWALRLIAIFIFVNRNGMKWNAKVDERTREKIELLYKEFDKFIEENHAANSSEDAAVLKQWNNFKQII